MISRKTIGSDTSGGIAIFSSVAFFSLAVAAGMAIDVGRALSQKTALQAAMDTAILAAAREKIANANIDDEALAAYALKIFSAQPEVMKSGATSPLATFSSTGGKITGSVTTSVPTTLLKIAGFTHVPLSLSSGAELPGFSGEVAFVLDNSSSMSNSMHVAMIEATRRLLDKLTSNKTNTAVKISIVPFSKYVRVAMPGQYALGGIPGTTWSNCTNDRKYPHNVQNTTPNASVVGSLFGRTDGNDTIDADEYADCDQRTPPSLLVRPLTNDHAGTDSMITGMITGAGTNIFVGLQFGWHTLTPNGIWNDAAPFGQTKKYIILLTDGRQNQMSFAADGSRSDVNAWANTQTLCTNIKASGVTLIAIAYDIDDPEGKADLQTCVTGGQYYHEADQFTLDTLMQNIGGQLMASGSIRLTQ